jgi:hypothetical protein
VNDPSARKIKPMPAPKSKPLRTCVVIEPSTEIVDAIARHLLPITPEEVLYRGAGESPLLSGVTTAAGFSLFSGLVGATSYGIFALFADEKAAPLGGALKTGFASGAKWGVELGIAHILELEIACARGRAHTMDKVIAGATAGAICGAPGGLRGMASGAAQGVLSSAMLALVQASVEYL